MDTTIKEILVQQKCKFDKGGKEVLSKRQSWNDFAILAEKIFNEVIEEGKNIQIKSLYIFNSRNDCQTNHMLRSITLYWGKRPTRTSTLESNDRPAFEDKCMLNFSQSVHGDVICIMYPFESELHKSREDYLILSRFHQPSWYDREYIIRFIKYFFSYSQISSFIGNPDTRDTWTIRYLRCRSWLIQTTLPKATKMLLKTLMPMVPKLLAPHLSSLVHGVHILGGPEDLPL